MNKKRELVLQDSVQVKEYFKMYKVGKTWLVAGLFTISLGAGFVFGGHQDAYAAADTESEPGITQTATGEQSGSQASEVVIGDKGQSASDTTSNLKAPTTPTEDNNQGAVTPSLASTPTENATPKANESQAQPRTVQTTNLGDVTDESTIDKAKTAAATTYAKTGTPQTITAIADTKVEPTSTDPAKDVEVNVNYIDSATGASVPLKAPVTITAAPGTLVDLNQKLMDNFDMNNYDSNMLKPQTIVRINPAWAKENGTTLTVTDQTTDVKVPVDYNHMNSLITAEDGDGNAYGIFKVSPDGKTMQEQLTGPYLDAYKTANNEPTVTTFGATGLLMALIDGNNPQTKTQALAGSDKDLLNGLAQLTGTSADFSSLTDGQLETLVNGTTVNKFLTPLILREGIKMLPVVGRFYTVVADMFQAGYNEIDWGNTAQYGEALATELNNFEPLVDKTSEEVFADSIPTIQDVLNDAYQALTPDQQAKVTVDGLTNKDFNNDYAALPENIKTGLETTFKDAFPGTVDNADGTTTTYDSIADFWNSSDPDDRLQAIQAYVLISAITKVQPLSEVTSTLYGPVKDWSKQAVLYQINSVASTKVDYVDDDNDGALVETGPTLTGLTNSAVNWTATVPANYQLAPGQASSGSVNLKMSNADVVIHLVHQTETTQGKSNVTVPVNPVGNGDGSTITNVPNDSSTSNGTGTSDTNTEITANDSDNNTIDSGRAVHNSTTTVETQNTVGQPTGESGIKTGTQAGTVQPSSSTGNTEVEQLQNLKGSATTESKAATLPQTNEQNASVWTLLGLGLMSMMSLLGFTKQKKHD